MIGTLQLDYERVIIMDKIVIFGATQFSSMLHQIIERESAAKIVAYTINENYISDKSIKHYNKYPLVPFEEIENIYPPSDYKILNSIGYLKMNSIRQSTTGNCINKGYEIFSFISKDARVFSDLNGIGNIVLPGAFIGYDVEVGNSNIFYTGCLLTHHVKVKNNSFIAAGCTIGGYVTIGSNCFLGLNSTIKNRVNINDYSLVGASTYISKDTEAYSVYVPERSFKLEKLSTDIL